MNKFSFEHFDQLYLNKGQSSLEYAYKVHIEQLEANDRPGTASNCQSSINSLISYKKELVFEDITVQFLKDYDAYMRRNGKSISTINFYLGALRGILNQAIERNQMPENKNPFGKGKYKIPKERKIKTALKEDKIEDLFDYIPKNKNETLAKDMWIFCYLCGGINMGDALRLQYKNINEGNITLIRQKTRLTSGVTIILPYVDELKEIIEKHGNPDRETKGYIFQVLSHEMNAKEKMRVKINFIRKINSHLEKIKKIQVYISHSQLAQQEIRLPRN